MFTIAPPSPARIARTACLQPKNTPFRLTARIRSSCSSVVSASSSSIWIGGVVDHHVEAPEALQRLGDQRLDSPLAGHVCVPVEADALHRRRARFVVRHRSR